MAFEDLPKTAALRRADRILRVYGGDPASASATGGALERFLSSLRGTFQPVAGGGGFRDLVEDIRREVVKSHPVLRRYPVKSGGNRCFGGLHTRMAGEAPAEVWNALTHLLGEFLARSGAVSGEEGVQLQWIGDGGFQDTLPGDSGGFGIPERSRAEVETVPRPTRARSEVGVQKTQVDDVPAPGTHWRVMVLDRDRNMCAALAEAVEGASDFQVVDYGFSAEDIRRRVDVGEVDFIVASAQVPPEDVLEVCSWLRQEHANRAPQVVVAGLPEDPGVVLRFLESGAAAFTMEDVSVQGLRLTLRLLARGEAVFPRRLQHLITRRLSELAELVQSRGLQPDTLWTLTSREGEVLLRLEEGLTNGEIAKKLFISEGTVKSHVHQILKKLKVRDRNEAVRILQLQRSASGGLVLERGGFRSVT